jgi:hypothetical protein
MKKKENKKAGKRGKKTKTHSKKPKYQARVWLVYEITAISISTNAP